MPIFYVTIILQRSIFDADFSYSIVVRISAEVTKPRDERPFDGLFNINMELTAMGSPAWENGRYASITTALTAVDFS